MDEHGESGNLIFYVDFRRHNRPPVTPHTYNQGNKMRLASGPMAELALALGDTSHFLPPHKLPLDNDVTLTHTPGLYPENNVF